MDSPKCVLQMVGVGGWSTGRWTLGNNGESGPAVRIHQTALGETGTRRIGWLPPGLLYLSITLRVQASASSPFILAPGPRTHRATATGIESRETTTQSDNVHSNGPSTSPPTQVRGTTGQTNGCLTEQQGSSCVDRHCVCG
jgi:hypothetical protein